MTQAALFSNNAQTTLAFSITNVATSLTLVSGTGALFPNPSAGQFFSITLTPAAGGFSPNEIVYCTARSSDVCTIVRAREGTTAAAWNAGDNAQLLLTAGTIPRLVNVRVFNTPGTSTYTPTPGTNFVIVGACGAGAGGAGSVLTAANGTSTGSPGSGGGYGESQYSTGFSGVSITIGAAGSGGAGAGGANGGDTTFNATPTALVGKGGIGGGSSAAALIPLSGGNSNTPSATGANLFVIPGSGGVPSFSINGSCAYGGSGGSSAFSPGGAGQNVSSDGLDALGFGGGGSGTANFNNGAFTTTGGDGSGGIVIVWEYA